MSTMYRVYDHLSKFDQITASSWPSISSEGINPGMMTLNVFQHIPALLGYIT